MTTGNWLQRSGSIIRQLSWKVQHEMFSFPVFSLLNVVKKEKPFNFSKLFNTCHLQMMLQAKLFGIQFWPNIIPGISGASTWPHPKGRTSTLEDFQKIKMQISSLLPSFPSIKLCILDLFQHNSESKVVQTKMSAQMRMNRLNNQKTAMRIRISVHR